MFTLIQQYMHTSSCTITMMDTDLKIFSQGHRTRFGDGDIDNSLSQHCPRCTIRPAALFAFFLLT